MPAAATIAIFENSSRVGVLASFSTRQYFLKNSSSILKDFTPFQFLFVIHHTGSLQEVDLKLLHHAWRTLFTPSIYLW